VPNFTSELNAYLNDLPIQRVILSGGNDLSSEFTGLHSSKIHNPSPDRDALETRILNAALEQSIPVLGICRGMQFINCFFGGGLTQDIESELPEAESHIGNTHNLVIHDSDAKAFWGKNTLKVNSYHHQGVQIHQVAKSLKIIATSEHDQLVEALYHPKKPIAGIQWHPERKDSCQEDDEKLIRSFLEQNIFWSNPSE
jgi:putative glutamine amidotransferase